VEKYVNEKGINAFYHSIENRKECCFIRKVKPLNRALENAKVWITGLRSEQSENRENMPVIEWDEDRKLYKYNPLIHWNYQNVLDYLKENKVQELSLQKRIHQCRLSTLYKSNRRRRKSARRTMVVGKFTERVRSAFSLIQKNKK
jgi:3'-phosphoadenosine 5'-phosphosulfate sulfotransferase (PAPS reductase)/FAD synthetase